tara:strand:+ start:128 stop:1567 length:1440 start_codon:yes stop_codon:yes gene_type:complete
MKHMNSIFAGLLLAYAGNYSALAGETFTVPGNFPTIQTAINSTLIQDGDTILVGTGSYPEHSINTNGKAITIQGTLNGDGSLATTIDAQQGGSVFVVNSGEGNGTVIRDLVITGGSSWRGGGINCYNSSPTITDCTISGNTGKGGGGGIDCFHGSEPTISGCTISNNTVSDGGGGGIGCSSSSPTISGCTISNNMVNGGGGGIDCFDGSEPTISDCTIKSNTAQGSSGFGGGISCVGSSPTISGCTISYNTAGDGGGISCLIGSNPTISSCKISHNIANGIGGGIQHINSSTSILSDTIVCGNTPDQIHDLWTDNGGNTVQEICPSACCTGNERFCVQDAEELDCLFWGGEWLGEATTCDECPPLVGPDPVGACCLGGTCITATESSCTAAGGTYGGDNVACDDASWSSCGPEIGACCYDGLCFSVTEDECNSVGGSYADEPCSIDTACAAACDHDSDNDGDVDIEDLLTLLSTFGICQ